KPLGSIIIAEQILHVWRFQVAMNYLNAVVRRTMCRIWIAAIVVCTTANSALADIVTGSDNGATSTVKGFDSATSAETDSFLPYGAFNGGVRVAAGDLDGDGHAEIITGAGDSGSGNVKVFDGNTGTQTRSFFAYGPSYSGGVFVG